MCFPVLKFPVKPRKGTISFPIRSANSIYIWRRDGYIDGVSSTVHQTNVVMPGVSRRKEQEIVYRKIVKSEFDQLLK